MNFLHSDKTKKPLLVISFDDGNNTDYSVAYQEMKLRNMVGTTYLNTAYNGFHPRYLNVPQILEMYQNGWDFQCHTYTHEDVTNISDNKLHRQMIKTNEMFERMGLPKPKHHAYPYGYNNAHAISIMRKYRKSLRCGYVPSVDNLIDYENFDLMRLNAINADFETTGLLQTFKDLLDHAIANDKVLFVYWHRLENVNRINYFKDFLDYVVASGIEVVTHAELYKRLTNYSHARNWL